MNETGPGDSKEDVKWLDDQLGEFFAKNRRFSSSYFSGCFHAPKRL